MTNTETQMYNLIVSILERDAEFARLPQDTQVEIAKELMQSALWRIDDWRQRSGNYLASLVK